MTHPEPTPESVPGTLAELREFVDRETRQGSLSRSIGGAIISRIERIAATPQADRGDDPDRNVWDYLDGPSVRRAAQRLVNAEDALADAHAAWPVHVGTYDEHLRVQHAAETELVTAKASLRAALRDTAPSGLLQALDHAIYDAAVMRTESVRLTASDARSLRAALAKEPGS